MEFLPYNAGKESKSRINKHFLLLFQSSPTGEQYICYIWLWISLEDHIWQWFLLWMKLWLQWLNTTINTSSNIHISRFSPFQTYSFKSICRKLIRSLSLELLLSFNCMISFLDMAIFSNLMKIKWVLNVQSLSLWCLGNGSYIEESQ